MNCKDLLMRLSQAVGVSGREDSVTAIAARELETIGEVTRSPLGDLICTVRKPKAGQKNFMLDAHVDEIGMIVTWIDDEGFLKVSPVGGFDRSLLLAAQVAVHTKEGTLPGVICSIPPHLQSGEAKNPKFEEIYIDIGYNKEEAQKRVSPGDMVTFVTPTREMHGGFITGKAIDNRSSCAAVMRAAELLKDEKGGWGLSVTLTTREEVGGMGAQTAVYTIKPDIAVAVETTTAADIGGVTEEKRVCFLSKGPVVSFMDKGTIYDKRLYQLALDTAAQHEIKAQPKLGVFGGNNAGSMHQAIGGVRPVGLSMPCRYLHTPSCVLKEEDITATYQLLTKLSSVYAVCD